ncbi:hypothetical protein [Actinoplanes aureus]|uniref:Uncharacterized protein n=1 Tax=Actinoplanes aureus TaxID=2792083 RepID=A0A931CF80_9ACTN|nr:hypothetical protein [Actinoplanes aureus]MBG0569019.1 hypothetical protein [Actinoplanes aureus]
MSDGEVDEYLPLPNSIGHPWISVGTSRVLLESQEDIYLARFYFELWNGPPPPLDSADWPINEDIVLYLPSGRIAVYEFTSAQQDVFNVEGSGHYHVRLAWRAGTHDFEVVKPQAFALVQFWVADAGSEPAE